MGSFLEMRLLNEAKLFSTFENASSAGRLLLCAFLTRACCQSYVCRSPNFVLITQALRHLLFALRPGLTTYDSP